MNELHVKLMVISYKIGTCILNEMYLCTGYKLDFYRNCNKQSERDFRSLMMGTFCKSIT